MKSVTVVRPAWWKVGAVGFGLALLAVACGSGGVGKPVASGRSPGAAVPSGALCEDLAALRVAAARLDSVHPAVRAARPVDAALADLRAQLAIAAADGRGRWQPQTAAAESALAGLRAAAEKLARSPGASAAAGMASALGRVGAAVQDLLAATGARCPAPVPLVA